MGVNSPWDLVGGGDDTSGILTLVMMGGGVDFIQLLFKLIFSQPKLDIFRVV